MKPQEQIIEFIDGHITKTLAVMGFKFRKSKMDFTRTDEPFCQGFHFRLNKYNQENLFAEFWLEFYVTSKFYSNWHVSQYDLKPYSDNIVGIESGQFEHWQSHPQSCAKHGHFDVVNADNHGKIAEILLHNITTLGIPFLEKYSDWKNAASYWLELGFFKHNRVPDFLILSGQKEQAMRLLKNLLNELENSGENSFAVQEEAREIKMRINTYAI